MSRRKGFQRAYWFSGETITKLIDIHRERKFPSQTLALETIIDEAHQNLGSSPQFEEKPLTLEDVLSNFLGDELSERHIKFLEEARKEGESLEDVFRKFINWNGIQITKEEWKERIQEGNRPDPFKLRKPEICHYRGITEEGEWYCDTKKIPPEVCIKRQERYQYMGRKCTPITKRSSASQRKKPSNRRFCKRDKVWFNMGEKDCIKCTWFPTECPTKREALKKA